MDKLNELIIKLVAKVTEINDTLKLLKREKDATNRIYINLDFMSTDDLTNFLTKQGIIPNQIVNITLYDGVHLIYWVYK